MNYGCRLMQVPKWMRLLLGWILIGIGLLLFITPIPGGILFVTAGIMLLFCASPTLQNRFGRRVEQHPWLSRRFEPLFKTCHVCPKECPGFRRPGCYSRITDNGSVQNRTGPVLPGNSGLRP
jgi:hypothetical protein